MLFGSNRQLGAMKLDLYFVRDEKTASTTSVINHGVSLVRIFKTAVKIDEPPGCPACPSDYYCKVI